MHSFSTRRKPEPSLQPSDFLDDVLKGLARTPRYVPPRWFYDMRGSELFELEADFFRSVVLPKLPGDHPLLGFFSWVDVGQCL